MLLLHNKYYYFLNSNDSNNNSDASNKNKSKIEIKKSYCYMLIDIIDVLKICIFLNMFISVFFFDICYKSFVFF